MDPIFRSMVGDRPKVETGKGDFCVGSWRLGARRRERRTRKENGRDQRKKCTRETGASKNLWANPRSEAMTR